ncbi:MAG: glycogen(starch) synthase [Patiriisocius sp.]|jgi:glycogen(starch) synthase
MKVLTFGWDFPPHTTGGLGVACQGLTRELAQQGVEVVFVLPKTQDVEGDARFIFADVEHMVRVHEVNASIAPYLGSQTRMDVYDEYGVRKMYQSTLIAEVHAFAHKASEIAGKETFDLIHAHDWTSYLAGIAAKIVSGKPLILHVHATAFDQAAGNSVDPSVFAIEKEAFDTADRVIAVSQFTKNLIVDKYDTDPEKVQVMHNGVHVEEPVRHEPTLQELKAQGKKIVLYHGRITIQKGVDYFVQAARKVIEHDQNIVFIISGKGDMTAQIMRQVGELGLSQHILFAGALWYEERDRMYQSVDLVVMPSVSEPFGLVPLEAIQHGAPSLISKQSGVSEVVTHVLKVDFWDVEDMANKILAAMRYPVMHKQLVTEGQREVKRLSWKGVATKVRDLYQHLLEYIQ